MDTLLGRVSGDVYNDWISVQVSLMEKMKASIEQVGEKIISKMKTVYLSLCIVSIHINDFECFHVLYYRKQYLLLN